MLKLYDTLTKTKKPFKPQNNNINWYICGPTVYDSPHIGHARTYISFDVIRSVLENYFGYNVTYAMNITDVDDKIIAKAKESFKNTKKPTLKEFSNKCAEITQKYENEFFDDLKMLNCKSPSFVTRVSEYIPVIEKFISDLIDSKFAYKSNGSVYFDIDVYRKHFEYPCFVDKSAICDEDQPVITNSENNQKNNERNKKNSMNNEKNSENNERNSINKENNYEKTDSTSLEGLNLNTNNSEKENLTKKHENTEKRNIYDFALWKSRNEDLFYKSNLGNGRPGWHIECSAMAHSIFPDGLDIHTGGIDLSFPHHENEMAQSQAKINKKWVSYWLHTGHLHINGLKMSKSLKNFITIKDFLLKYTSRQIRLAFLLHKWWLPMTFSEDLMLNAISLDSRIFTFLSILESKLNKNLLNFACFTEDDTQIFEKIQDFKNKIHLFMCDNIDTSGVIKTILDVIAYYYSNESIISSFLLNNIYVFLTKILTIFGLYQNIKTGDDKNCEIVLNILNDYRNEIRDLCKKKADLKEFYLASDKVRDGLKDANIILEDSKNKSTIRKKQ